jgi:hypothetical protein
LVWLVLSAAFALFIVVAKVHTYLGVKVKPTITSIAGFETSKMDMNGHEHVWRVWWRARHEMLSLGPNWGFTALLTLLGLLFVGLCVLAIWVALVPNETPARDRLPAAPDVAPSP